MRIILGSQSPQRFALLKTAVAEDRIEVWPPASDAEPGFDNLHRVDAIERQLEHIVDLKFDDVRGQLAASGTVSVDCCLICADTVVVATNAHGQPVVLGKPPTTNWQPTVRHWFQDYYAGQPHQVWTAFCIGIGDKLHRQTVKTQLTLCALDEQQLSWYLATEEPIGKAGGYAVQGIAAMFVQSIQGSLTNVVGLPMQELAMILRQLPQL